MPNPVRRVRYYKRLYVGICMKGKRRSRQAILAAVTVLAAAHQDYEAVLVDESGTIWLTPGLKDRFIPVDQGETREIRIL